MGITLNEMLNDDEVKLRLAITNIVNSARMAMPGIIVNFNPDNQTATVQPAIKERVQGEWVQLPQLLDVPVQFPRAGGYCLTFPVKQGDECLVVFSDMCIDAWWQSGDVQVQLENRRHDLSDAVDILGITSVPNAIKSFADTGVQLRDESGENYFEISEEGIKIKAKKLIIEGDTSIDGGMSVTKDVGVEGALSASGNADVKGNIKLDGYIEVTQHIKASEAIIDDIKFTEHKHKGVTAGGDKSDKPLNDKEEIV